MKNNQQKKSHIISFRVNDNELANTRLKFCDEMGEPVMKDGEIAKRSFLGCTAIKRIDHDLEKYKIATAARIGNNINQIAHRLNTDNLAKKIDNKTYQQVAIELQGLVEQLNRLL
ncbi:MAG: plasmid mobilization relaxosome protein MobC [Methylococcales bacterium]|nr:plasmid mobilization relaxosome protein MobC [Methylococcales bacterium]